MKKFSKKAVNKENFIEVIGMPASGKSTLVKDIVEENTEFVNLNDSLPSNKVVRQIFKLAYIMSLFIISPKRFIKDSCIIISSKQKSLKDLFIVILNWHLIIFLYSSNNKNNEKTLILDQGIFQAVWSIYFTGENNIDYIELLKNRTLPDEIYFINVNDTELIKRSQNRGTYIRLDYKNINHINSGRVALNRTIKVIEALGYK